MALLTVDEVRDHVETSIVDDALERLIDNADQEIIDRLGALASQTEVLEGEGLEFLHLHRRASSITSAVERILETNYTLASTDYLLLNDGYRIQRLQGTNFPAVLWNGKVTIVYVPADETVARKKLLVDLVRLDCVYDATKSKGIGDVSVTAVDHAAERVALFAQLQSRNRRVNLA